MIHCYVALKALPLRTREERLTTVLDVMHLSWSGTPTPNLPGTKIIPTKVSRMRRDNRGQREHKGIFRNVQIKGLVRCSLDYWQSPGNLPS